MIPGRERGALNRPGIATVPASLLFFSEVTHASLRGRQGGSVLITLIVSMTVFAVLGAAMYSLFSTSRVGVSAPNNARRAYYLAESGLRYTASEARNRNPSDVIGTLLSLNSSTVQVAGSGKFTLTVNPYFGIVTGVTGTVNTVPVSFGGSGFPEDFTIPANALLQVGANDAQTITDPPSIAQGATTVVFTLGGSIQLDGSTVFTVFHFPADVSAQPISQGGQLILDPTVALGGLPVKNGSFVDNSTGILYHYDSAAVQAGKVVLYNVTWSGGTSVTVAANADMIFCRAATVTSVGSSGPWNPAQKLLTDTFSAGCPTY